MQIFFSYFYYLSIVILFFLGYQFCRGTKYKGQFPNLKGKYAIVTGANTGIGKVTAKKLAQLGCNVIIGARDKIKSQEAVKEIKLTTNNKSLEFIYLDLSDRSSIQQFVQKINFPKIDYLVNNAGIMGIRELTLNKMNIQMHNAVNHQGHFYLTYLLWNKLNLSEYYRIVNISSSMHYNIATYFIQTTLDWDNMNFQKGNYYASLAYARSKLYNNLFTKALSQRIPNEKGISASLHPGNVRTEVIRNLWWAKYLIKIFYPIYCYLMKSPEQGAQTIFFVLFSKEIKSGKYYQQCKQAKQNPLITSENVRKLWKLSQLIWNINFK